MANAWIIKPLPLALVTTPSAAAYSGSNIGNDYAGLVWQSNGSAGQTILVDLGADYPIDTIALFGLVGFTIANPTTIRVATAAQGNSFGAGAFTTFLASGPVLAGSEMPVSGRGVGLYSLAAAIVGRYVLLTYSGLSGAVQISRAVIGQRIQLERNYAFGGSFGVRDLGSLDFSRRGVLLRTRGKKLRTLGLTFSNVNKDEVEASTKPLLEQIGNTEPVALFTDPDAHAQRQNRGYFGPLVGDLANVQRTARSWEVRVNMVSLF
jgi:hypothetical protein